LPSWTRVLERTKVRGVVALPDDAIELPIDGCLDLHTFQPGDIGHLVPDFILECRRRGFREIRIVHGKGRGDLRRGVEAVLARTPGVTGWRTAHGNEGAWGATIVAIAPDEEIPHP